jgi:hypothetical protein
VGIRDDMSVVVTDGDATNNEWAAKAGASSGGGGGGATRCNDPLAVQLIDTVAFMKSIACRRIPEDEEQEKSKDHGGDGGGNMPPRILVKLDVEGYEELLWPVLRASGLLCSVDFLYAEHVSALDLQQVQAALKQAGCPLSAVFIQLDDESYHRDQTPLPAKKRNEREEKAEEK